jgi:hypothetical protein
MTRNRYSYVATFMGHLNSHDVTSRRIGYQWFVIDRMNRSTNRGWFRHKVVKQFRTRREARELARSLNNGAQEVAVS